MPPEPKECEDGVYDPVLQGEAIRAARDCYLKISECEEARNKCGMLIFEGLLPSGKQFKDAWEVIEGTRMPKSRK